MAPLSQLSRSVEGKVALVTGAASGMGRATAHLFADEGVHVAVTDLGSDRVEAVVAEIQGVGLSAHGWTMDVADAERVEQVVSEIVDRWGGLDIVVNNAGISRFAPIDAADYEDQWAMSLEVLLTAQTRVIRAALPHLRAAADGGRIVNIASTEGWGATRFGSPYTAAKHGVIGLTKSLAVELGRENITVNCICPGPISTGMTAEIADTDKEVFAKRRTAIGRYGAPEEVAHGTLNFCLPASRYMTGAVLPVDGGLLIKNA
ncbi:MAG: SDR family oxidoreductase [Actinomycetia bacterium]|nr:SDR family oxidoreductase [Actinomycetes bacterium]MCP4225927.1 SDR family oxidoreductase [Actinomycetes bacterium]MCP5032584.1 SDR family oxidoreductase [Actinomycetes bacterium]